MTAELAVVVDFQQAASIQGRAFEELVERMLAFYGWQIVDRRATVEGVEVDIVATDPDGVTWWIECKGSHRGRSPGSKRGDTVKKAVGVAWYLSTLDQRCPYMLVTSHMPAPSTVAGRLLAKALEQGLFAAVYSLPFTKHEVDDLAEED